jgi:hypothetical protein
VWISLAIVDTVVYLDRNLFGVTFMTTAIHTPNTSKQSLSGCAFGMSAVAAAAGDRNSQALAARGAA